MTSVDKIVSFRKKLIIWKKYINKGNFKMFRTIQDCKHTWLASLILDHLDGLLLNIDTYFPSLRFQSTIELEIRL